MSRSSYRSYITSELWYAKHPNWLKAVGYRCSLLPWVKIGKGKLYRIHHLNYQNLGNERLRRDVIPVCPFAHDFIIHGVLSGFKPAGKQREYPNSAQRLVHLWCAQRLWVKWVVILLLGALLIKKLQEVYLSSPAYLPG